MKQSAAILGLLMVGALCVVARGEAAEDLRDDYRQQVILSGLDNPWGIATRAMRSAPGTLEIYLAESGAGRVLRIWTKDPKKASTFVEGYEVGPLHSDSPWRVGPLGVDWVTPTKLAVTTATEKLVRVYGLPLHSAALELADAEHLAEPSPSIKRLEETGIRGMTSNEYTAYYVMNSVSPAMGILKSEIRGNRLKRVSPFLSETVSSSNTYVTGVSITPSDRPEYVVVARQDLGNDDDSSGSRLTFYDPGSGAMVLDLEVPLVHLTALAYSPSGNLYGLDVRWDDPKQGGLYRLDDARREGRQICNPVRIASLARPIDLRVVDRNTLYVSCLGEEVNERRGSLVKITGDF